MADVCSTVWKDYTDNYVTEQEFNSLSPRAQEQVKRAAMHNLLTTQPNSSPYYPHVAPPSRYKHVDWLKERKYFDGLRRDDDYVQSRLGFKAPNIFVMDLVSY